MPSPFPQCIVDALVLSLVTIPGADQVVDRPLWPTDPNATIGVSAVDWTPIDYEIGHYDPALAAYNIVIESLAVSGDAITGRSMTATFAKSIRTMLYRDQNLRVRLAQTQETVDGVTERVLKWKVRTQRFVSNLYKGNFLYVSTTELVVETESG